MHELDNRSDSLGNTSPIFIVGAPRSGTTMLRLALNAHPNIGIPPETDYFSKIYEHYAKRDAKFWPQAVQTFIRMCESKFHPAVDLHNISERLCHEQPDFGRLLSLPIANWTDRQGKIRWGEKTPLHIFYTDIIMQLFPTAKIITMQRDPRAVVASMNQFAASGHDTTLNSRLWRDVWTHGREIMHNSVPLPQGLMVRYESLIQNPEDTMKGVCTFLNEEFFPSMLTFGETASTYVDMVRSTKIEQPIQGDPTEWRHKLSSRQIAVVEHICKFPMEALGYTREGRPLRSAEMAEVTTKLTYAKYKQWQHRKDRYHSVTYTPFGGIRRRLIRQ